LAEYGVHKGIFSFEVNGSDVVLGGTLLEYVAEVVIETAVVVIMPTQY